MEYGRLIVLGYSSYRVGASASSATNKTTASSSGGVARSPPGEIIGANGNTKTRRADHDRRVIGQMWEPIGDQNTQYTLTQRKQGNGVKLRRFHHFYDAQLSKSDDASATKCDLKTTTRKMMQAITTQNKAHDDTHRPSYLLCVPMNDADAHASVAEYVDDASSDMFQIGRMPCAQNDVVIPGPRVGASGTISRFAARILCSRKAPYECRIFAGGFDSGRKMTTAGHAFKFCAACGAWLKRLPADHKCIHDLLDPATTTAVSDDNQQQERDDEQPSSSSSSSSSSASDQLDGFRHIEMEVDDPERVPIDGLTKNGVRVWLPDHKQWFEVSVNGNLYAIAPRAPSSSSASSSSSSSSSSSTHRRSSSSSSSSVNPATSVRHSAFNRPTEGIAHIPAVLPDGALIDLGGVQLQFQSTWSNQQCASDRDTGDDDDGDECVARASMALLDGAAVDRHHQQQLRDRASESSVASKLDRMNVHCPVQLHPLQLRDAHASEANAVESERVPHVFPACGHVFGFEKRIATSKMCPLCRQPGDLVRLQLKESFQLMSRAERQAVPECVFNPCGHAISSKLAQHYAALLMPNGRAICPFCAVHLDSTTPFARLYLYSESEDEAHGDSGTSRSGDQAGVTKL